MSSLSSESFLRDVYDVLTFYFFIGPVKDDRIFETNFPILNLPEGRVASIVDCVSYPFIGIVKFRFLLKIL